MYRRRRRATGPRLISPWPFVGMGLMAASLFLYGASGLLAPAWAVVALLLVWLVLFVLSCRWWTPHPTRLPFVALFAVVFWFAALVAGGAFLDWSA
jgi:hypothetical protein